jgi:hypothetical protein
MNALRTCPSCHYAHEGEHCPNPACFANPSVSETQKARWTAEREKREAEEAERQRIRDIRRRMAAR